MCWILRPQIAYLRQASTEEDPIKATDPPEPSPSVLTMGIPYFTRCISRARGTPSSMAPNYRSLYHHRMRKSKFPSRDMLRTIRKKLCEHTHVGF